MNTQHDQRLAGLGSMGLVAGVEKLGTVPETATVSAKVGLGPRPDGGWGLAVKLELALPGVDRQVAERMVARGHDTCPYPHATRGNVAVMVTLV